jgi:hypothetical protein
VPPNARTCKHLKELLGITFEESRILTAKDESKSTEDTPRISKKRKDDGETTDKPPKKQSRKAVTQGTGRKAALGDEEVVTETTDGNDTLLCFNGIKRNLILHLIN